MLLCAWPQLRSSQTYEILGQTSGNLAPIDSAGWEAQSGRSRHWPYTRPGLYFAHTGAAMLRTAGPTSYFSFSVALLNHLCVTQLQHIVWGFLTGS